MYWANFLHFYQPADQQPDILEAIVTQSYRPIFRGLQKSKTVRLTININGALLELIDRHGYRDLLDLLREAGKAGRVEFTGSAKYHAFLPFLDNDETIRQITVNNETNHFFLGDAYQPRGFFPPEMAYTDRLAKVVSDLGFEWMILDEIAFRGATEQVEYTQLYTIKGTNLKVFFRQRRISNLIMSAVVRKPATLKEAIRNDLTEKKYIVTAMDGETFGHHRPGLERLLFDIFNAPEFTLVRISDITEHFAKTVAFSPIESTWASSQQDIQKGIHFLTWSDPQNPIHTWQNTFVRLALSELGAMDQHHPAFPDVRMKMDKALASDHFWWASAKPWWSLEMIEDGAYRLLDILRSVPDLAPEKLQQAKDLYENIVSTAFQWQRSGKIRKMMHEQQSILRIPFKDRTIGRKDPAIVSDAAGLGVYNAFIDMMKRLEKEAALRGEYEKAILWRDAIYKIDKKYDIYDALSAIDLLRLEIPHEEVEKTIEKYKDRYRELRGGQPEQRGA